MMMMMIIRLIIIMTTIFDHNVIDIHVDVNVDGDDGSVISR